MGARPEHRAGLPRRQVGFNPVNGWSTTWLAAGALALGLVLVVAVVLLSLALVRSRAQTHSALDEARHSREELLRRLEQLERPVGSVSDGVQEFVITDVGVPDPERPAPVPTRIEGRLFVDVLVRETVVKAASWTYGVRRGLSAENRNRLRFEMRRETKVAAKRRKADIKEALRQYYANQERTGGEGAA